MRFSCISEPQRNATSSVDVGLAEPDHLAARPHRFAGQAEGARTAGCLQHDVGAAAAGQPPHGFDRVLACGVDGVRGAKFSRETQLVVGKIDRNDGSRARHAARPARRQARPRRSRSPSRRRHSGSRRYSARRRPRSSRRSRSGRPDRTAISFGTTIACCAGTMQYSANAPRYIRCFSSRPSRRARAACAVELHARAAPAEIILAQDRQVAVAIEAMPAMRIPRQHDVIANGDAARLRARPARRRPPPHGPRMIGIGLRKEPSITSRSVWQRPAALIRTSTSPAASRWPPPSRSTSGDFGA